MVESTFTQVQYSFEVLLFEYLRFQLIHTSTLLLFKGKYLTLYSAASTLTTVVTNYFADLDFTENIIHGNKLDFDCIHFTF